jgi:hypothetical protein
VMRYLPGSRLLVAGSAGVALLAPESAAETACRLHTMLSTPEMARSPTACLHC